MVRLAWGLLPWSSVPLNWATGVCDLKFNILLCNDTSPSPVVSLCCIITRGLGPELVRREYNINIKCKRKQYFFAFFPALRLFSSTWGSNPLPCRPDSESANAVRGAAPEPISGCRAGGASCDDDQQRRLSSGPTLISLPVVSGLATCTRSTLGRNAEKR